MLWVIFLKKTLYHKLITKVNAIDTSGFLLKSQYSTDKLMTQIRKQLILVNSLKTSYNAEITEIERKIPGVTSLSTTSALNAVEKDIQRQI